MNVFYDILNEQYIHATELLAHTHYFYTQVQPCNYFSKGFVVLHSSISIVTHFALYKHKDKYLTIKNDSSDIMISMMSNDFKMITFYVLHGVSTPIFELSFTLKLSSGGEQCNGKVGCRQKMEREVGVE